MTVAAPDVVLVAGSGSIAQRHIRNLLALGVREVLVVTGRNLSDDAAFADPRIRVLGAVPHDCPRVAVVANDTDAHVDTARELVDLGAHVLIEKPLAGAVTPGVTRLAEEVAEAGVIARIAYNMRFLPAVRRIVEIVSDGTIGRPLFARIEAGQWLPSWRIGRDYREGYSASGARGGGVGLDLSHEIDYMRLAFGMPLRWTITHANTGTLGLASDEVFEGAYEYPGGFVCSVHLDYLEPRLRRRIRVVGSRGVVNCDIAGARFVVEREGESQVNEATELFDLSATYPAELMAFFREVDGQHSGLATLDDGLDVLRLLADRTGTEPDV